MLKGLKKSIKITFGVVGFVLYLVSNIMSIVLMPLLIIYGYIRILLIKDAIKRDNEFGKYNRDLAVTKDILGNIAGRYLFNDILRKDLGYPFGRKFETISSALGKNQRTNKLTIVGKCLCWILDKIDENHCQKSIYSGDCLEDINYIYSKK